MAKNLLLTNHMLLPGAMKKKQEKIKIKKKTHQTN